MLSEGFLYRRLAGIVPCALPDVAAGALVLRNKWQVASLRDVFLSSHYWRLFDQLDTPPSLVVDLGAHCGHFVILCEMLIDERFGTSAARYVLVEGLSELVENIRSTLADTGLESRCTVLHGLVGQKSGSAYLSSGRSNLLEASAILNQGERRGPSVSYLDLSSHIPDGATIDILKVDIEGSEYDLVETYPTLLERTRVVAMEIHDIGRPIEEMFHALGKAGLEPCLPHIRKGPNQLVLFKRKIPI